jgi:hypothetical protein
MDIILCFFDRGIPFSWVESLGRALGRAFGRGVFDLVILFLKIYFYFLETHSTKIST